MTLEYWNDEYCDFLKRNQELHNYGLLFELSQVRTLLQIDSQQFTKLEYLYKIKKHTKLTGFLTMLLEHSKNHMIQESGSEYVNEHCNIFIELVLQHFLLEIDFSDLNLNIAIHKIEESPSENQYSALEYYWYDPKDNLNLIYSARNKYLNTILRMSIFLDQIFVIRDVTNLILIYS